MTRNTCFSPILNWWSIDTRTAIVLDAEGIDSYRCGWVHRSAVRCLPVGSRLAGGSNSNRRAAKALVWPLTRRPMRAWALSTLLAVLGRRDPSRWVRQILPRTRPQPLRVVPRSRVWSATAIRDRGVCVAPTCEVVPRGSTASVRTPFAQDLICNNDVPPVRTAGSAGPHEWILPSGSARGLLIRTLRCPPASDPGSLRLSTGSGCMSWRRVRRATAAESCCCMASRNWPSAGATK